jgi:hypothetical protein
VALLFAVLAGTRVKALFRAVASEVTRLLAVNTLDYGLSGLILGNEASQVADAPLSLPNSLASPAQAWRSEVSQTQIVVQ